MVGQPSQRYIFVVSGCLWGLARATAKRWIWVQWFHWFSPHFLNHFTQWRYQKLNLMFQCFTFGFDFTGSLRHFLYICILSCEKHGMFFFLLNVGKSYMFLKLITNNCDFYDRVLWVSVGHLDIQEPQEWRYMKTQACSMTFWIEFYLFVTTFRCFVLVWDIYHDVFIYLFI